MNMWIKFALVLTFVSLLSCSLKNEQVHICLPYGHDLNLSLGETLSAIQKKLPGLESAYFYSGDTLVYVDYGELKRNEQCIQSTLYLYFLNDRLRKIHSLYEYPPDGDSFLHWLKNEIGECHVLTEARNMNNTWEYFDDTMDIQLVNSFDSSNNNSPRCWYLIEQRN